MEVRDELIQLYATHNPRRLKDVDALLDRFRGREHVILRSLRERYEGSEAPSALSSSRASALDAADGRVGLHTGPSPMGSMGQASHAASRVPVLKPGMPVGTRTTTAAEAWAFGGATASTAGSRATAPVSPAPTALPPFSPASTPAALAPSPRAAAIPADGPTPTGMSATRCAEMRSLLRQMTSLDVAQLAGRVAELTHASLLQQGDEARVPRLQWRQTAAVTAVTQTSGAGRDEVATVLHHTAVFVSFFAECARRYLELAEEAANEAETAMAAAAPAAASSRPAATRSVGVNTASRSSEGRVAERESDAPRSVSPHLPSPPSPPPKPHSAPPTASCVRHIRTSAATTATGGSPLSTDGAGSPPACRTTTVSPLSSPDRRTPTKPQRHPHVVASPPPPPPLPSPPPQSLTGGQVALVANTAAAAPPTRVLTWTPAAGEANRYGPGCGSLRSGDCVVLQPGVYHETLHLEHCGAVEITSAFPGAAVVLRPGSDLEPIITVAGADTRVTLTGIVLVQGDASAVEAVERRGGALGQPTVPLLSVRDGAELRATASHFYGGAGGGIVAAGADTRLRLDLCLVSLCGFAGVYVHGGASADISQSKVKKSEVGLRVMRGAVVATETTLEANTSDGIVLYEESMAVLERSNVFDNAGNGAFLASGAELRVVASTIELNALYGVQRARGSSLHVKSSFVRDNGLLPISEVVD